MYGIRDYDVCDGSVCESLGRGCFALVYGTKMKYETVCSFGIHMPKEAQKDPEVQSLMEQYAVRMKNFTGGMWQVPYCQVCWHLAILPSLCLDGCSDF